MAVVKISLMWLVVGLNYFLKGVSVVYMDFGSRIATRSRRGVRCRGLNIRCLSPNEEVDWIIQGKPYA